MKRISEAFIVMVMAILLTCSAVYKPVIPATNSLQTLEDESDDEDAQNFSHDKWTKNHTRVRGILVTGPTAGTERMNEIFKLINETELNAIVLDVKDDFGNISFVLNNEMVAETNACIPYISDIDAFIDKAKKEDVYVIARIACFKDPVLANTHPELSLKTSEGDLVTDGSGNPWVNPCKEEVWDYIISIASSCADLGFDEIQLDYVRFPVGSNAEQADYSVPADDENRQQYIGNFLERAVETLHEKNVPVTADVFGTIINSDVDSKHIGQNYVALASKLDALCPMIYPSHYASGAFGLDVPDAAPYETVYGSMSDSKEILLSIPEDERAVIRPWLQAFTATWVEGHIDYDGEAIRKEIQGVYDAGYEEWILWSSKSEYSAEGLLPK